MSQAPNILFLFPDQQRHDWLTPRPGLGIRTPNVQRLVHRGTRFSHAICPSPVCGPSRACLATGRRYERSGVMGNFHNTPDDLDTVYQHLREAGYAVLGCGKFDLAKASYDWQLDGRSRLETWGFTDGCDSEGKWDGVSSGRETPAGPYLKYLHDHGLAAAHVADMISRQGTHAVRPTPLPEAAYGDNWVGAKAEDLLRHTATDQPWFLQVNFPGPHEPWDITAAMADSARELEALPSPFRGDERLTPAHHHAVRQNYAAMIENIDRWVGRLLQVVAQRGEAERTIVVYASDHGEMLGDHGMWGKSQPQEASVRVPLVVCGAADLPGGEVSRPTDLLDLSASFLSWAGRSVPEAWDSRPLSHRLADPPEVVFSGLKDWRLATDGRWKLVAYEDGRRLLFDLAHDPQETRDVAAEQPEPRQRLEAALTRQYRFAAQHEPASA